MEKDEQRHEKEGVGRTIGSETKITEHSYYERLAIACNNQSKYNLKHIADGYADKGCKWNEDDQMNIPHDELLQLACRNHELGYPAPFVLYVADNECRAGGKIGHGYEAEHPTHIVNVSEVVFMREVHLGKCKHIRDAAQRNEYNHCRTDGSHLNVELPVGEDCLVKKHSPSGGRLAVYVVINVAHILSD